MSATSPDPIPSALRQLLEKHRMLPLWESSSHGESKEPNPGQLWRWSDMRPILAAVAQVSDPKVQERRVLSLLDHRSKYPAGDGSVGTLNATLQTLLPGERARPHRHTIDALRFVLETSGGARTIVDGKSCPMEPGDLVLTPGWTWHEHVHEGKDPVFWLDVLDVVLRRFLDVEAFQPGPVIDAMPQVGDELFSVPNLLPVLTGLPARPYSPVFRYPWSDAARAVALAPIGADGVRRIRYAHPQTGGPSLQLLDSTLVQIDGGQRTCAYRSCAPVVCCVAEGSGKSEVEGHVFEWTKNDVFTLPANSWSRHQSHEGHARLFQVSNRPVFDRLGLFTEQAGGEE